MKWAIFKAQGDRPLVSRENFSYVYYVKGEPTP